MNARGTLLVVVAILGIAVAALLFFSQEDRASRSSSLDGEGSTSSKAPAPLRRTEGLRSAQAGDTTAGTDMAAGGSAASGRRRPLTAAMKVELEKMMDTVAQLDAALKVEKAVEETETEAEEKLREDKWSRMVTEVRNAVRSIPELATALYESSGDTESDAMATRLARILQSASHPEFVDRLRVDAVEGRTQRRRRMAIVALEMRDAEVFLEPVTAAYMKDADPVVRDEAAGVLSRSMMDRKHIRSHVEIRNTVQTGLSSDTPADRARAVRALLADTRAGPDELERIRALEKDPDADVRREVQRALRVLTPRVERALKRR